MTTETATATPMLERGANVDDAADYLDSLDLFGLNPKPESAVSEDDEIEDTPRLDKAPEPETDQDDEDEDEQSSDDEDDSPAEDRTLTLEAIAAQLGVEVDDLYGLELATKIDGKEGKATLRDLQKSYQLQKHINAKSEEASSLRKQAEEFKAQAEQELIGEKKRAIDLVRSHLMGEYAQINWEELKQDDPDRYAQKWIEFQQKEREFNRNIEEYNGKISQQQQAQQEQMREYLSQQSQKLYDLAPEWADENVKKSEQTAIKTYLQNYGFTEQEMGIYDARYVAILRDAMRYNQLKSQKPGVTKKANEATRVIKSGTKRSAPAKGQEKAAQFFKSRSLQDAASLLAEMDI